MGVISIVSLWFTLGVSGLVFGIIGISLASKNRRTYKTGAGFVLSIVALIISAIFLVVVLMSIVIVFLMPDSIGAYFIRDVWESVLDKF